MTPSSALATVLVDELRRNDIREVVLCPGSRSAPLAYAVLAAEREGRVRLHVRVDERSAGFLALGLAAASRRPVAVVTTSGTAVVNLHPAVLEAHHGGVPLVVVSADRPHELRGTGANQTTLQPGVFGDATRYAADIPAPVVRPGLPPFWRSTVCRAVAAARGWTSGSPGPVHLNVCLREPLVPDEDAPPWPDSLEGRPGEVVAMACALPAEQDVPLSRWSCPEIARELAARCHVAVSASSVRRWLAADALKPWQHRSWISIRDPDFEAKAARVLDLYAGRWKGRRLGPNDFVICADEKTSIQARCRCHPPCRRDGPARCGSSTSTSVGVRWPTWPPGTSTAARSSAGARTPPGSSRSPGWSPR